MASPSPATKKITAITKPTKPPTTFLSLARELRQRILSETYQDDDEAPWRVALSNQQWSATLNAIHPALFSDVDYVNSKWVEDMIALAEDKWSAKHPSGLTTMRDEDRAAVWTAYWGDTAPWSRAEDAGIGMRRCDNSIVTQEIEKFLVESPTSKVSHYGTTMAESAIFIDTCTINQSLIGRVVHREWSGIRLAVIILRRLGMGQEMSMGLPFRYRTLRIRISRGFISNSRRPQYLVKVSPVSVLDEHS
ncbi:hypothetical protein E6O75_ATG02355 [Venturia nashicola]|uniref:Uncharacterized protein n=1 Tax=Venturia nashicola TaxID=86259 RepID=A0A4Z1PKI7_9PEZI|nr:hypothetical protein E6O75_ATG02355 [Venturia nashicola]